jgi:hypothetical protein
MRMRKSLQKFGYLRIFRDGRVGKNVAMRYDTYRGESLPYEEFAGRVALVSNVKQGSSADFWRLEFRLEDTGEKLLADVNTFSEVISGIALVADIENARSLYMGKSLWLKQGVYVYDQETDEVRCVPDNHDAIKVLDVIAGWSTMQPVRFVVETRKGEKAFVDVIMSGTNSEENFQEFHAFQKVFHQNM